MNAYVKNVDNQKVLPITKAKNVFDENGINLEEHLDLIYSELSKRDIKRIYMDVESITDKVNPSTFDILSAMADNTIALLAVENDSHLVAEIGARLGGVLLLFRKTSVYFSSAIFFTYRYGEVYTGSSGLGGTSFVWFKNTKTIHSFHSGEATTLGAANSYVKITEWGGQAVNPRLSNVNGSITIPSGVHRIMISAYIVLESKEDGSKFLRLFKNGAETNIMVKTWGMREANLAITPLILEVEENDELDLRVFSNSDDTLRSKHFTIEVIE